MQHWARLHPRPSRLHPERTRRYQYGTRACSFAPAREEHPARPGRIRPQRKGDQSGRHRHRGARTRPPADIGQIIGVARDAIGAACADKAGGELVEVGLADADRARRQQAFDHRGRGIGPIGKGGAGGGGFKPRHIDIVLHRKGDACKGQILARRHARVDGGGGLQQGFLARPADPDLRLDGVIGGEAGERVARHRHRAGFSAADGGGDFGGGLSVHACLRSASIGAPGCRDCFSAM